MLCADSVLPDNNRIKAKPNKTMKSKILSSLLLLAFGAVLMTSSCRKFETDDLIDPIIADTPTDGENRKAVPVIIKDGETNMRSSDTEDGKTEPVVADTPTDGENRMAIPIIKRDKKK